MGLSEHRVPPPNPALSDLLYLFFNGLFKTWVRHFQFAYFFIWTPSASHVIELDDGKIYRKTLYLMIKTMVSCRFSLKPAQWSWFLLMNPPSELAMDELDELDLSSVKKSLALLSKDGNGFGRGSRRGGSRDLEIWRWIEENQTWGTNGHTYLYIYKYIYIYNYIYLGKFHHDLTSRPNPGNHGYF